MPQEPRWLTPSEQQAWRSFVRVHLRLDGLLSRRLQAESNLSSADYGVLVSLTDVPDGRQRLLELARVLEWEKSRMSHHITRMVRRGLVIREECAEDGRGAFVVITPAGRAAITAAAPLHVEAVRRLVVDVLTPEELGDLHLICERILQRLEKESA
jgi:DNA-binding MarR family transcriptional regulator